MARRKKYLLGFFSSFFLLQACSSDEASPAGDESSSTSNEADESDSGSDPDNDNSQSTQNSRDDDSGKDPDSPADPDEPRTSDDPNDDGPSDPDDPSETSGDESNDTNPDEDPDDGQVDEEVSDLLGKLIRSQCEWLFQCCSRGELNLQIGPFTKNADECVDRVLASLETGGTAPPVESGPSDLLLYLSYAVSNDRVALNADGVMTCVDQSSERECNLAPEAPSDPQLHCDPDDAPEPPPEDPCADDKLFVGQQKAGDDCTPGRNVECQDGLRCVSVGSNIAVCTEVASEGDYCFSDSHCDVNLFCDYSSGRCAAPAEEGEACSFTDPEDPSPYTEATKCAEGLNCHPTDFECVGYCETGTQCSSSRNCPEGHACVDRYCHVLGKEGDWCSSNSHCESGNCDEANESCRGKRDNGEYCYSHVHCESGYCDTLYDECREQVELGETCSRSSSQECKDGFCKYDSEAQEYVCTRYNEAGEECSSYNHCNPEKELACILGTCEELPLKNGSDCTSYSQCESGLCWNGSCEDKEEVDGICTRYSSSEYKPCNEESYCDIAEGDQTGVCRKYSSPGRPCESSYECRGNCVTRWNHMMCDTTPAPGAAFCDGE